MTEAVGVKNNNGRNGIFLKVIIGALATGLVASSGGMVKLYREVGELRTEISGLTGAQSREHERRILEAEAAMVRIGLEMTRIGLEQARRTNRIDILERDVARNREDIQRLPRHP